MSDKVSLSKKAIQNPHQSAARMLEVIEEDSFREDKEKLRYSAEELDEVLRSFIEDVAKKPEEFRSFGPGFGIERIGSDPTLDIWFTFDAESVHLLRIWESPS